MSRSQAKSLLEKYNNGSATSEERKLVENWYLKESLKYKLSDQEGDFLHLKDEIFTGTLEKASLALQPKRVVFKTWTRMVAAVVVLAAIGIGLYHYTTGSGKQSEAAGNSAEIAPGGNKAILTLGNGEKVVLNNAAKGEISRHSGISISKSGDGELIYSVLGEKGTSGDHIRNTISTPNGGQYTVILSDGTKVMLNSASSLTFPASFGEGDRWVELSGEAYFEVAKQKSKHFKVISGLQTVEVLGTHFNVNAYADEGSIKTTLLEGAVKVSTPVAATLIEPGEQAVWNKADGNALFRRRANTAKEMAWVNGVFSFEGDDLAAVMRQVSRWYDVDVVYSGKISEEKYFGEIARNSKLSAVFKILELNNVHFDVRGKTVRVSEGKRNTSD